ncbi:cullin-4A [Trichonephila clavipes]|nr:cullin-4A [Trichonephila clavipes]
MFPCIQNTQVISPELIQSITAEKHYLMMEGLGSNPGEDMDVCKCIVPLQHGGTLNRCRAASSLVWLVEGEVKWEAPDHPPGLLPQNWSGNEPNCSVTCMVLKATANDRCHLALCHDESRWP